MTVVPALSFEITRFARAAMAEIKSEIFDVVMVLTCWFETDESAGVKLTVKSAARAEEEISAISIVEERSFMISSKSLSV